MSLHGSRTRAEEPHRREPWAAPEGRSWLPGAPEPTRLPLPTPLRSRGHGLFWGAGCLGGLGLLPDPLGVREAAVRGDKLFVFLSPRSRGLLWPWQKEPGPAPRGHAQPRPTPGEGQGLSASPPTAGISTRDKGLLKVLYLQASINLLLL